MLADIKTFEMHRVYGFGINTAMTWQNDETVRKVSWYPVEEIIAQLELLIPKFRVDYFKVGIIEDEESLRAVCSFVKAHNPGAKIVWDPVLSASAGYSFFEEKPDLAALSGLVDWITPNLAEFRELIGDEEKALQLSKSISIYRKGGHDEEQLGKDFLYRNGEVYPLNPKGRGHSPKHGSGCVFSSALCANLAQGYPFLKACLRSKRYIERVLSSNKGLLGWHYS